VGTLVQLTEAA